MLEKNIELLKKIHYPLTLISDNHLLQEIDENYDGLNTLNSLEYAIYYTFQESFDAFQKSWNYKEQKTILSDLDMILDRLYDLKETQINKVTGEEEPNLDYSDTDLVRFGNQEFNQLYDLISDRYYFHHDTFYQNTCKHIVLRSFDQFCEALLQSKEYLYQHDINLIGIKSSPDELSDDSSELSDDSSELSDDSDENRVADTIDDLTHDEIKLD